MRKALLALLLLATAAQAQSVTLPAEVVGQAGAWIVVVPDRIDGGEPKWKVGAGLIRVPLDKLFPGQKAAGVVVQAAKDGVFEVWAWNAKGDTASELAVCRVVVGKPIPPDPGPDPKPDPDPPTPSVNPFGPEKAFRVLIVYETADAIPPMQRAILVGTDVRNYLRSKSTDCYRFIDKDADVAAAPAWVQAGMKRPRQGVPWIVIGSGDRGFEGPLPATIADTLTLLKKYGG